MLGANTSPEPPSTPLRATEPCGPEMVRRALAGEAHAFEDIMRCYNRLLFRSARGIASDDAQAQDVVQDAYLQAFLHLKDFRGAAALGTWLVRITINVALQSQRRKGRLVQLEDGWDSGDMTFAEIEMPNQFAPPEPPDRAAERGELRVLLQTAIEDLPVIYRSVFMLRAVENMPVDEVAECLGVNAAVVKTRFLRARSMLRDALADRVEIDATLTFAFAGARCDAVVAHVLAALRARGQVR